MERGKVGLSVLGEEVVDILVDPLGAEGKAKEDVFVVLGEGIQLLLGQLLVRKRHCLNPFTGRVLFLVLPKVLSE